MTTPSPSRRPEVLAPAGDPEALRAAVAAGADAVYFGLQGFNARARAANFDAGALADTLRYLHTHGVKGYVTLNTLVFDAELEALESAVRACAAAGVDAVIVQDLGVARLVRAIAPTLPIHASTQMTCTDAGAVELAAEVGASRVILARELSLEDIARIRERTDVELEVFVHGALCISYSGQCLTSEAIGGRSANRGACAQACRLPYELVVDGVKRELGDRAYLLSPEDLEASALVPELARLGVSSIKIEGRLKGPEYVAAVTRLYRAAVDGEPVPVSPTPEAAREVALQTYSRGSGPGFLAGIDHQRLVEGRSCDHRGVLVGTCEGVCVVRGKRHLVVRTERPIARGEGLLVEGGFAGEGELGGRVWDVVPAGSGSGGGALVWLGPEREAAMTASLAGRRVFRTSDPARTQAALTEILRDPRRRRVDVRVHAARIGDAPSFAATSGGVVVSVVGDAPVERGEKRATSVEELRDKLGRLGETPFALGEVTVDLPERAMVPMGSVNRARRALVDALVAAEAAAHAITPTSAADLLASARAEIEATTTSAPPAGLFVLCRTLEQAHAALDAGADGVVLDFLELTGTGAAVRALRARSGAPAHVTLAPPRIRKPGEEKIDKYLAELRPDAVLVRGLGALREGAAPGVTRIGDFSLNVTNRLTAAEVLARGLDAFTPSFDLDADQLLALLDGALASRAEVVVHHPMPLFHMEHCVIAALLSDGRDHKTCGRPCERHQVSLRDRAGMDHPVEADVGCRNTVFHAAPQSAATLVPKLLERGVRRWRVELVRETAAETARVVDRYRALLAGRATADVVWRELRAAGGYGVVRGSLRVVSS